MGTQKLVLRSHSQVASASQSARPGGQSGTDGHSQPSGTMQSDQPGKHLQSGSPLVPSQNELGPQSAAPVSVHVPPTHPSVWHGSVETQRAGCTQVVWLHVPGVHRSGCGSHAAPSRSTVAQATLPSELRWHTSRVQSVGSSAAHATRGPSTQAPATHVAGTQASALVHVESAGIGVYLQLLLAHVA